MSLNFALGQTVGKQIAEKIGLDPNRVTDITITMKPNDLVRLTVHYIPDEPLIEELIDTYIFVKQEVQLDDERVQRVESEAGPQDDRGSASSTGGREDSEEAEDDCPF
jgi:hypothetical protein